MQPTPLDRPVIVPVTRRKEGGISSGANTESRSGAGNEEGLSASSPNAPQGAGASSSS